MIFTGISSQTFMQELSKTFQEFRPPIEHNITNRICCMFQIHLLKQVMYFSRLLIVGVGREKLHFSKNVNHINLVINIFMSRFFIKHCTDIS